LILRRLPIPLCILAFLILSTSSLADDAGSDARADAESVYSPYADREYPSQVYWGDTHLHTALSMDAGAFGNRLGMDEAYRFARGEEVVSSTGQPVRLSRPLDFLVIADHSDGMGFFPMLLAGDPIIMAKEEGRRWKKWLDEGKGVDVALEMIGLFSQGKLPYDTASPEIMRPVWNEVIAAADRHDDPGSFTAFIGYEWTSLVAGNNLHRVVIYRDDGDKARLTLPYTNEDSSNPEDFWVALQAYENQSGGKVLAIPHNGNLSNGLMFSATTLAGEPIDKAYAETRIRWEPLYEVTQIKGDGEAHPLLSPDDEFADYETWAFGNLDLSAKKSDEMLEFEYGRSALKLGLNYQKRFGVNPYRFGMIGSTDSHTSLTGAEENNFFGKHAGSEPSPDRMEHTFIDNENGHIMSWRQVASGYAAVWAHENTREAIWDAMKRKEVYATTGPRITVRFFGGWSFDRADTRSRSPEVAGYAKGVPMGGELGEAPTGRGPSFLVAALRDPIGANLDRIQIVKGWLDGKNELHEKVYDVVWSDAKTRELDASGKLAAVGNTVDITNATWSNSIGDADLIGVWKDPDFNANQQAFYYARVIEIPTPRWTAYDAQRFGVKAGSDVKMTGQERAYTSPIWYTP
jgi:hypothetical protein